MKIAVISMILLSSASAFASQGGVSVLQAKSSPELCTQYKVASVNAWMKSLEVNGEKQYIFSPRLTLETLSGMTALEVEVSDAGHSLSTLSADFKNAESIEVLPGSKEGTAKILFHPAGAYCAQLAATNGNDEAAIQLAVDSLLEKSQAK